MVLAKEINQLLTDNQKDTAREKVKMEQRITLEVPLKEF
jgi:hypothetical protein